MNFRRLENRTALKLGLAAAVVLIWMALEWLRS